MLPRPFLLFPRNVHGPASETAVAGPDSNHTILLAVPGPILDSVKSHVNGVLERKSQPST